MSAPEAMAPRNVDSRACGAAFPAADAPRRAGAKAEPPDEELGVLLIRAAKALVDAARAERPDAAVSSLTPVHGLAARYLLGRDDVTAGELARHLGITKQSVSEVVAALERTGSVRRAPHPHDGRARVLLLTAAGEERLEQGRRRWRRTEDEWLELVGRERLATMRQVLETILAADVDARELRARGDQNGSCAAS